MVNGRIQDEMPASELAHDKGLQERLLGLRASGEVFDESPSEPVSNEPATVVRVQRAYSAEDIPFSQQFAKAFNSSEDSVGLAQVAASQAQVFDFPVAASSSQAAYVAGTFDTKGKELFFLRQCLEKLGLRVVTVDLSTTGRPSPASVHPREVARHHPQGEQAVFSSDRGSSVAAMALALSHLFAHAEMSAD
jgi:hypothetical protein